MDRHTLVNYLDELFQISAFSDYCVNGLQVEGTDDIQNVITAVSVSEQLFHRAISKNADLIIVHHGLFWKNSPNPFYLKSYLKNRVKLLLENDINLVAYHLPMDAHPILGNNAQILKSLGIFEYHPFDVGFWGQFEIAYPSENFKVLLDGKLPNPSLHLNFGPDLINRVAVVSGGSSHLVEKLSDQNIDAFITGDLMEQVTRIAEELNVHVFSAGHYNSEVFGPKAIADHLKSEFNISVEFIDIPNPV